MTLRHRMIVRAIVAVASTMGLAAQAATSYSITNIGTSSDWSFLDAYAVNDSGAVTGYGYSPSLDTNVGFLYQNGQLTSLGLQPGAATSGGSDINNAGVVAGSGGGRAFTWQAGQFTELPALPGATYASANAINASGTVAGSSGNYATIWVNGQPLALNKLSTTIYAVGIDINAQGAVAGTSYNYAYQSTPVTWVNGQPIALSTGTYNGGGATAINGGNSVAGYVELGGNLDQAARWDDGQLTVLDLLTNTVDSRAYALNDAGQVVGVSFNFAEGASFATLWEGSQAYALQDLLVGGEGWTLNQALDINSSGQIVGWGTLNGRATSFLLTPVPEAASWAYMALGLAGVAALRRRAAR